MRADAKSKAGDAPFSVLGEGVTVRGDIDASGDLHVEGTVEGDVTCAALILGEHGRVAGGIKAASARIAGTVEGSIDAETLVVESSARTTGDIAYGQITMEAGAKTEGKLAVRGSETLKLVADAESKTSTAS
ncbi:MAG: polymer-forming cytoskeletal protein [Pacificimonas sp.]